MADLQKRKYRKTFLVWTSCKWTNRGKVMRQRLTVENSAGALVARSHRQDTYRARADRLVQSSERRVLPARVPPDHFPRSLEFLYLVSPCLQQPSKATPRGCGSEGSTYGRPSQFSSDFDRLLAYVWLLVNILRSATTDHERRRTKQAFFAHIWRDLCKMSLTCTRNITKTFLLRLPGLGARSSSQIEQWICSLRWSTSLRTKLWLMIFCQSKMATRSYTEQLSIPSQVHRRKTWKSRKQTGSGWRTDIAT